MSALVASLMYALVNTILTSIFSISSDDSYWSVLLQQLAARREGVIHSETPGLVVVQIDGLARPILARQVQAGRVPAPVRHGCARASYRLDGWEALLPPTTPASQAGILHGNNDGIPAFRWYEKDAGPDHGGQPPRGRDGGRPARISNGEGLLSNDGASVGNLFSGDAARSYISMATIKDKDQGLGKSQTFVSFFGSPYTWLDTLVRFVAEMVKEYVQARRAERAGIVPRMHRGMPYPVARAATNVALRDLSTALVIEEMYRGTPVVYVDYTDYDEIAHHSGPERSETLDALDGVDRAIATLEKAAANAPRPYRFVIVSDHGQTLGATFLQRYGKTLGDVVRGLMGGGATRGGSGRQGGGVRPDERLPVRADAGARRLGTDSPGPRCAPSPTTAWWTSRSAGRGGRPPRARRPRPRQLRSGPTWWRSPRGTSGSSTSRRCPAG